MITEESWENQRVKAMLAELCQRIENRCHYLMSPEMEAWWAKEKRKRGGPSPIPPIGVKKA